MSAVAWESLHKATLELARSPALKQRLTDAFRRYLLDLPVAELPGEIREDFETLRQSMTRIRPGRGECPVVATVRKMSIGEADDCAKRIVGMLDRLHRTSEAGQSRAGGATPIRGASDNGTARIPTLISVNRA